MFTEAEIDEIVGRIARTLDPEKIIMFGSYAKRTVTPASDLDLLVVLDTPLPPARRTRLLAPLVRDYSMPIDLHVYTPAEVLDQRAVENSFINAVMRTGRTLYSRSGGRLNA